MHRQLDLWCHADSFQCRMPRQKSQWGVQYAGCPSPREAAFLMFQVERLYCWGDVFVVAST